MEERNKVNTKDLKNRFSGIRKSTVLCIVFSAAALLVLLISAVFGIIGTLKKNDKNSTETAPGIAMTDVYRDGIPDINSSYVEYNQYLNLDGIHENPVDSLNELDEYRRSLRIIHSYSGITDAESLTLTKSGECIKAESDSRIITKNKSRISSDYGTQKLAGAAGENEFYEEVGITSLEMLKEMLMNESNFERKITVSENKRYVIVDLYDRNTSISMNFEIDVETGIVITERFYNEDALYRFVFTEDISRNTKKETGFFDIIE